MFSEIGAAVTLAKEAHRAIQDADIKLQVANLVDRLMEVQLSAAELFEENVRLKETIGRFENFEAESDNYYRDHLSNGAAVYRHSDYTNDPEERNRYCCACFENQKIATLQPVVRVNAIACADNHTIPIPVDTRRIGPVNIRTDLGIP